MEKQEKYIIQSLQDGIDLLLTLCHPVFESYTQQELAQLCGLGSGKVLRILKTLESRELVRKGPDGRWGAAPKIVAISDGFRRHIAKKKAEIAAREAEYLGG